MKRYIPEYVDALCQEVKSVSDCATHQIPVKTLFFGGGTPSLLSAEQVKKIIDTTASCFIVDPGDEVTLEANPGTVNRNELENLHRAGINRISFGMQSSNPSDLRVLNRRHCHDDVIQAVEWSRKAGFKQINLDLIFGIPGQTLEQWKRSLDMALLEHTDHLSLYSLSVEEGTPLNHWINRGLLDPPDDDLAAEMYEYAEEKLESNGFIHYEISNWAITPEAECRHNLQYWLGLPYLGFGAGAHGFYDGIRIENENEIIPYIARINSKAPSIFPISRACIKKTPLSKWDQMQEYLMVGFRLTDEGVSQSAFQQKFSQDLCECFKKQMIKLEKQGLIEIHPGDNDRLRLSAKGRLFGNRVFLEFVGNEKPDWVN